MPQPLSSRIEVLFDIGIFILDACILIRGLYPSELAGLGEIQYAHKCSLPVKIWN